jgi:benzoate/toluate 1,2-dioxygenase beta subunit
VKPIVAKPDPPPGADDSAQTSLYVDAAFYAALEADVAAWCGEVRPVDEATRRACEAVLFREARLLDAGRLRDWLALFAEDCLYWVPRTPGGGAPRREVSLAFDDRRRLLDRIARLETGSAWSQIPPSRTVRLVTNVEASAGAAADEVRVRSTFVVHERRRDVVRALAGWNGHVLRREAGAWKIARKMVNLLESEEDLENLSLVL